MSCCEKHGHDHNQEVDLVPTIQIGKQIPSFDIEVYDPASYGFETVSLQELRTLQKWVVLFFYPADFTFVCPTELADLAEQHETLSGMGVEIVSMSTDTKFAHMAWRQSEQLLSGVTFKMGADPTGEISRHFGIYDEETGLAARGTFIICPKGNLVGSEINYDNVGRNAAELVRKLKAFVYLQQHPEQVCPAKWVEGDKTLTPSADIVGNVYGALNSVR